MNTKARESPRHPRDALSLYPSAGCCAEMALFSNTACTKFVNKSTPALEFASPCPGLLLLLLSFLSRMAMAGKRCG